MPVPKGTKPRIVNFAEVSENDLRIILRKSIADGVLRSNTVGHRTEWTLDDKLIAKKFIHKKSEQVLVKPYLLEKLPKETKEKSNADQSSAA